jgi:hypothetical protein
MALVTGIAGYWPFEQNLTTWVGSTNLKKQGSTALTFSTTAGKIGYGWDCTNGAWVADSNSFVSSNSRSLNCWIKFTNTTIPISDSLGILGFPTIRQTNQQFAFYMQKTTGDLIFTTYGTDVVLITNANIDSSWHMISATYDSSAHLISVYLDGDPVASDLSITLGTTGAVFSVNWGGVVWSRGYLDELGLWNRALTAAEVSLLYNGGSGRSFAYFTSPLPIFHF